jgi:bifunctional non-homologous end joining protein LigD
MASNRTAPRRRPSSPAHRTKQPKDKLPQAVQLQLATLADKAPEGDQWLHEIKLDGYRMACRIESGRVQFISRNGRSWTGRLKWVAEDIRALGLKQALLDGEIVAMLPDGRSDFEELQNAFRDGRAKDLLYYVFDLLHYNGVDLRRLPLERRKELLAEIIDKLREPGPLRLSEHIVGYGPAFHHQACKAGLEGVISKRRDPAIHRWPRVRLAQSEVSPSRRIRDRRVHAARRLARGVWCAAAGLLRPRR